MAYAFVAAGIVQRPHSRHSEGVSRSACTNRCLRRNLQNGTNFFNGERSLNSLSLRPHSFQSSVGFVGFVFAAAKKKGSSGKKGLAKGGAGGSKGGSGKKDAPVAGLPKEFYNAQTMGALANQPFYKPRPSAPAREKTRWEKIREFTEKVTWVAGGLLVALWFAVVVKTEFGSKTFSGEPIVDAASIKADQLRKAAEEAKMEKAANEKGSIEATKTDEEKKLIKAEEKKPVQPEAKKPEIGKRELSSTASTKAAK